MRFLTITAPMPTDREIKGYLGRAALEELLESGSVRVIAATVSRVQKLIDEGQLWFIDPPRSIKFDDLLGVIRAFEQHPTGIAWWTEDGKHGVEVLE